jgi:hypothetical protein
MAGCRDRAADCAKVSRPHGVDRPLCLIGIAFAAPRAAKGDLIMPRGDKSKYSSKQKRQAEHIEEGYEKRGTSGKEAARRAWATVNKETHGGKKSGSGRGKSEDHSPSRKGGRIGGKASASRSKSERSASARKAAATRKARGH